MCRATLQTAGLLQRHLGLTHGDTRDRAYGIAALAARRKRSEPAETRITNETVLVCRPRLLSDDRDDDSSSVTTDTDSENDNNAALPPLNPPPRLLPDGRDDDHSSVTTDTDSENDNNAALPPLTPPRLIAELPELFPDGSQTPEIEYRPAYNQPEKLASRLVPKLTPDVADATAPRSEDRPAYNRPERFTPLVTVCYQDDLPDPRLHFLGAPSTTSSEDVATHLRRYRRRARRRPVQLICTSTNTVAILFTETATLADGMTYTLTQTWVPPPVARQTVTATTQT